MELWQIAFWTYQQYDMKEYQKALVMYIFEQYERVRWNIYQDRLELREISQNKERIWDIEIVPYDWNWEDKRPNFKYKEYWFGWYKYPWRWMTINQELNIKESIKMFEEIMEHIRSLDKI